MWIYIDRKEYSFNVKRIENYIINYYARNKSEVIIIIMLFEKTVLDKRRNIEMIYIIKNK